jgi:hypothetical protein
MSQVVVILDVPDGQSDPDDATGLTSEAFDELTEALSGWSLTEGPGVVTELVTFASHGTVSFRTM